MFRTLCISLAGLEGKTESVAEERQKNLDACKRVAVLGFVGNLFLLGVQIVTGVAGNSVALVAKAVESFGDLIGDGVSYLSIQQVKALLSRFPLLILCCNHMNERNVCSARALHLWVGVVRLSRGVVWMSSPFCALNLLVSSLFELSMVSCMAAKEF